MNVTVGAGSTSQDAQMTTAAALAESARQLAQSAAAFGEESDNVRAMGNTDLIHSDVNSCLVVGSFLVWVLVDRG